MYKDLIAKAIKIAGGQLQLANQVGISQAAVHKLLSGKSKDMKLSTAKAISKATGISIEEFFN